MGTVMDRERWRAVRLVATVVGAAVLCVAALVWVLPW
jgi:hypothetical protein